jgi:hypothetical protein
MAQIVDDARVGKKGYPRHWRELGLDAPMREAPDAPASRRCPCRRPRRS